MLAVLMLEDRWWLWLVVGDFSSSSFVSYNDKRHGAQALRVNVDHENGGMTLDTDFLVDFGDEPEGPALAHEVSDSETKLVDAWLFFCMVCMACSVILRKH